MSTMAVPRESPAPDPTVPSPEEMALIQSSMGFSLQDTDPAIIKHLVDRSRTAGNDAFKQKRYKEAVQMYSQAIAGDPGDATLFGNRSAAYLALGLYEQAGWDARKAVSLRPSWPKAHYRLGCAHMALSQWGEAEAALARVLELEPGSAEVAARLAAARQRQAAEAAARAAQAASERRGITAQLREARRADRELAMLNQFKQSMAGPEWEVEDLEWRPTFLPAMRLKPVRAQHAMLDPKTRLLAGYLSALADLAHPKQALRTLEDTARLQAYQRGMTSALARLPPGAHAVVLGSGGGLLPLLAAEAGAGRVTAVERSRMLYRMAKQVLESNSGGGEVAGSGEDSCRDSNSRDGGSSSSSVMGDGGQGEGGAGKGAAAACRHEAAARVRLLDRRLQAVGVRGEAPPPDAVLARQQLEAFRAAVATAAGASEQTPRADGEQGAGPVAAAAAAAAAVPGADQPTGSCKGQGQQEQQGEDGLASLLPRRASLLVTDLLDHSVLGMGLLPAVDYAADRLLAPGALVVPRRVQVYGMLLELRVGEVSGFDLSALNCYWWHPGAGERLELGRLPNRRLSAPFQVHCLDLQARVDARLAGGARQQGGAGDSSTGGGSSINDGGSSTGKGCGAVGSSSDGSSSSSSSTVGGNEGGNEGDSKCNSGSDAQGEGGPEEKRGEAAPDWELDTCLEVPVTADGQWNAVAFWFELHTDDSPHAAVSSWADASASIPGRGSGIGSSGGRDEGEEDGAAQAASAQQYGGAPAAATSWDQAVQYVDSQAVLRGAAVQLRVRQDSGQLVFTSHPRPQCRPRHALVPRWHYDMVLDQQRNDAYDAAIRRAVARKREEAGCERLLALDLGAGSGLLSMMAARAGADEVYAAEVSQHMCDVGEEACISNGYLGRITMLDRDARRMDVFRKPDGTPPDLPRRADLLVYEVFDSGCIGEGVLHILAAAQARLLVADAGMVPLCARVFCQPIQMRVGAVLGWDCGQANRWRWRPDYEGMELGRCRDRWVPLAPPQEAFFFDFTAAAAHMAPAEQVLDLRFDRGGVFNAVAMWFELQLDEESRLSTSPYADKGLTWQQAVQWVPEVEVRAGQHLQMTARHDTYSISYAHALPAEPAPAEGNLSSSSNGNSNAMLAPQTPGAAPAPLPGQIAPEKQQQQQQVQLKSAPRRTSVPLIDPAWQAAYDRLQGLNEQLVRACVQNPLEYRAVAQAALQFAARPHDLGVDAQQAAEFCVRMMG